MWNQIQVESTSPRLGWTVESNEAISWRGCEAAHRLHDAEAQWNDLSGEEEVDDVSIVHLTAGRKWSTRVGRQGEGDATCGAVLHKARSTHLDQRTDHPKTSQAEVLKWARLGDRVEKRVKEEGDVGVEEQGPRLWVRRDTLQQCERIAYSIRRLRSERGRR